MHHPNATLLTTFIYSHITPLTTFAYSHVTSLVDLKVAAEEASSLRLQLKKQGYNGAADPTNNNNSSTSLNEEMISMAEYLGT